MNSELEKIRSIIEKYALQNALSYDGKAEVKAVLSKILGELPELKQRIKEILGIVRETVEKVNKLSIEEQRMRLEVVAPELTLKPEKKKELKLPQLPNAYEGIVMRFAPGPSGPLHIGHARAAILNDEYVKIYNGKLILRIEDTDPDRVLIEAYDMIYEDLNWLGIKYHELVIQSNRIPIYYEYAKQLLEIEKAYICTCKPIDWRKMKKETKECIHRNACKEDNLEKFDKMLANFYKEEEASLIIKTDIKDPNPALRDFVALRIVDKPHPRTKDKYIVYPLMNYSVAIDDHLLKLTHVLRGKDHLNNTYRQAYIFDYFSWKKPEYIHYGRVGIEGTVLKKSLIEKGIKEGIYTGWDDVKLATLRALKRRGFEPEAIRNYWISAGIKEVDIKFSWENLYAYNKEIIDSKANRYFFVDEPVKIRLVGTGKLNAKIPLHPDFEDRGKREHEVENFVYLSKRDIEECAPIRLKSLCNIEFINMNEARYIGSELIEGIKIIHWVSEKFIKTRIYMPDGKILSGIAEEYAKNDIGNVVQFERFGFVRIDRFENELVCYFLHK